MLSFTDQSLALLVIAASAIPRRDRGQWLRRIARQLEPSPNARRLEQARRSACSPGARYTAAWRARERAGRCLLKIEVDEAQLVVALVDAGLLDPRIADDRAALTEAAQRALALYLAGEGSRHDERISDTVRAELGLTALQKVLPHVSKKRFRK